MSAEPSLLSMMNGPAPAHSIKQKASRASQQACHAMPCHAAHRLATLLPRTSLCAAAAAAASRATSYVPHTVRE